jgi:hypothetical protein
MHISAGTNCFVLNKFSLVVVLALSSFQVCFPAAWVRSNARNSVATGVWGGEHVILEVSARGAEAEFDCARGQITQPLTLDQHGDFDVVGTFTREHGGPVLRDDTPSSNPARYTGHVQGNILNLTIVLEKEKLGPFTLSKGSRPPLRKCL